MFVIFVAGDPKPQGSKTAYVRGNRAVLVEANKFLPAWRSKVTTALTEAHRGTEPLFADAVMTTLHFYFNRPKTNKRQFMTTKPDKDKLERAINDCLTKANIVRDDSYIVQTFSEKHYADDDNPAGVLITIRSLST